MHTVVFFFLSSSVLHSISTATSATSKPENNAICVSEHTTVKNYCEFSSSFVGDKNLIRTFETIDAVNNSRVPVLR